MYCLQESQVNEHFFKTLTDFVNSLLSGSKFKECSSIYYSRILIFGTTKGIENWFIQSKVKMTKKGSNLGFELPVS